MAVLLEGKFTSLFNNRLSQAMSRLFKRLRRNIFTSNVLTDNKMIVVADGDIVLNQYGKKPDHYRWA